MEYGLRPVWDWWTRDQCQEPLRRGLNFYIRAGLRADGHGSIEFEVVLPVRAKICPRRSPMEEAEWMRNNCAYGSYTQEGT